MLLLNQVLLYISIKKTGYRIRPDDDEIAKQLDQDSNDFTAWDMTDYVGNVYNRAVIYKGKYYHSAVQYFWAY